MTYIGIFKQVRWRVMPALRTLVALSLVTLSTAYNIELLPF
jgi:hypothetical protein